MNLFRDLGRPVENAHDARPDGVLKLKLHFQVVAELGAVLMLQVLQATLAPELSTPILQKRLRDGG